MKDLLKAFDKFLKLKGLEFETVVIGGAALLIMGVIERATRDLDCLDPDIPEKIKEASMEFLETDKEYAIALKKDWLNSGPEDLKKELPKGWIDRTISLYTGTNLIVRTLGRADFLKTKLYAYCDRQQDLRDCEALNPTAKELKDCFPWLVERDANPLWPNHVVASLRILAERLGYEFDPER